MVQHLQKSFRSVTDEKWSPHIKGNLQHYTNLKTLNFGKADNPPLPNCPTPSMWVRPWYAYPCIQEACVTRWPSQPRWPLPRWCRDRQWHNVLRRDSDTPIINICNVIHPIRIEKSPKDTEVSPKINCEMRGLMKNKVNLSQNCFHMVKDIQKS